MSRRIAYWALAAAAVLMTGPAEADRECFENSCRMPDAVELPLAAQPQENAADAKAEGVITPEIGAAPQADIPPHASAASRPGAPSQVGAAPYAGTTLQEAVTPKVGATPAAGMARAPVPAGIYPQMLVDRAPRKPVRPAPPAPRHRVEAAPQRVPARPAPRYYDAPAAVTSAAPAHPRAKPLPVSAPARAPAYVLSESAATAAVEVPGGIYADDGMVVADPYLRPDPARKLCQIDQRDHGRRYVHCGSYSYRPYGADGYRPYGSYHAYRSAPVYVLAPDAKIISIDTDN